MSCANCGDPANHLCAGCKTTPYCNKQCQSDHFNVHMKICARVEDIRPDLAVSTISHDAYTSAYDLLSLLKTSQANVITSESLTAGKLCATLVDIPSFGSYIYGGNIVYDSDAKRLLLDTVQNDDVYTPGMAEEMAVNALKHSRAIVSIAVTGKAGPAKEGTMEDLVFDEVGTTHIGVAIRTDMAGANTVIPTLALRVKREMISYQSGGNAVVLYASKFVDINRESDHPVHALLKKYRKDHKENGGGCPTSAECASFTIVSPLRDAIRWYIVQKACAFAIDVMKHVGRNVFFDGTAPRKCLDDKYYDGMFTAFGEPSWIIENRKL